MSTLISMWSIYLDVTLMKALNIDVSRFHICLNEEHDK